MTARYQIVAPAAPVAGWNTSRGWDNHQSREVSILRLPAEVDAKEPLRQARLLYGVRNPCVVTVFEFGQDDEGAYVVREMIKGKSLAARLDGRPLPAHEFDSLVRQSLAALDTIHTAGLIHGNLTPRAFILPWSAGGEFAIKITDFALGTHANATRADASFTAPELSHADPTLRADLYSLGKILRFYLAGSLESDPALAAPPPGLAEGILQWLDHLCAPSPMRRPASAEAALQSYDDLTNAAAVPLALLAEDELVAIPVLDEPEPHAFASAIPEPEQPEADPNEYFDVADSTPPLPATASVGPNHRANVKTGTAKPRALPLVAIAAVIGVVGVLVLISLLQFRANQNRAHRLAELQRESAPLGSDLDARILLDALDQASTRDAAGAILSRLQGGAYIDSMLIERIGQTRTPSAHLRLVRIAGERRLSAAAPRILPLVTDSSEDMRRTAWAALGEVATLADLPRLVALLDSSLVRDDSIIEDALAKIITRADDPAASIVALKEGYQAAKEARSRAIALSVLARVGGGPEASELIATAMADPRAALRREAIRLLADFPTHDPLAAIATRFPEEADPTSRAYLLLAAAELAVKPGAESEDTLARLTQSLFANARNDDERERALEAVSRIVAPATASFYAQYAESGPPDQRRQALANSAAFRQRLLDVIALGAGQDGTELPAEKARYTLGGDLTHDNGVLLHWTREADSAYWLVQFPRNGEYEVAVYQSQPNAPQGTYEVLLAGQTRLTTTVRTSASDNFKGFVIGRFAVPEPGLYRLHLRPVSIPPGQELMRLRKLMLRPIPDTAARK